MQFFKLGNQFQRVLTATALAALVTTLMAFSASAVAQEVQEVRETKLAEGVYMLEGQGGNMMLVTTPTHTLLVDAQFARMAESIADKIDTLAEVPLTYLFNTHFHGDHVGANQYLGEELGAKIIAHRNVRERLAANEEFPRTGLPTILADNWLQMNLGEYSLTMHHYATAHTDGDMVVWVDGQNIVHVGDLFFVDRFPFIDLNAGGTVQGYIDAIATLAEKMDEHTQIVPGHGPLMNKTGYLRLHDMIIATREQVRAWHAAGADVETMVATGLGAEWADWSWNFINEERWIRTLHNDLLAE